MPQPDVPDHETYEELITWLTTCLPTPLPAGFAADEFEQFQMLREYERLRADGRGKSEIADEMLGWMLVQRKLQARQRLTFSDKEETDL